MTGLPTNKFLVNRDKMRDASLQKAQALQYWETIKDAIHKIYNKEASSLSYEELYRTAYHLVLHKHGQMLYDNVKDTTVQLLKPIADTLAVTHDDQFLRQYNKTWKETKMCIDMIRDILLYMNKNFVPKFNLPLVENMQYSQFKHHVILNPQIRTRLVRLLIAEIRAERDGGVIDKPMVAQAIQMLLEVNKSSKKLYEQEFECVLL